ncbi:hypothetical protein V6S67_17690 [Arthrobacter sp. Soc17.1.1.1]|uniref:hypothetical protein n=1 Tax=Arthrobacter sp. Soc17.1.1.1 TaxID=3121277 RepID=UPI002FE48A70
MRDLANLFVQLALIVGILLIAMLVFDLNLGGVLAGCGAGLGIAVTQYVRARKAKRATVHGGGRRLLEG